MLTERLPCCRHCGWGIFPVTLADGTDLWHDIVHEDIRCLINPTGVHEPHEHLSRWRPAPRTAATGTGR
jgi:hypothetical protein